MSTNVGNGKTAKPVSIIQYKDEEIQEYEEQVQAFRRGEIPEADFMSFRLKLGVYGQRQADSQMFRVKIPGGIMHANQMDALGEIAERYVPLRKGHVTTRENVQLHHLTLEHATEAMRLLQETGLSTKEACGNTVRNVVACPMAGVDPQQAFDIQPYLGAYVRNFVRRDFTYHMPRKIKTAFSCGEHDCAVTPMHDIGFIARVREEDGLPRKGFKITVGGGTSIQPFMAETLYEFVPVEEFLRVCEAALRVFNRTAWLRKNKMKARIKVLVHTEGIEEFRRKVEEELQEEWAQDYHDGSHLLFFDEELADVPPLPTNGHHPTGEGDVAFRLWKSTNIISHQQEGYALVAVTVPQGDLYVEQWHGLAEIARKYASHRVRTTPEQNLMFRWVPQAYLYDIFQDLKAIGLADAGFNQITDVTSCPGTDSCKLGITSSMGLAHSVAETLKLGNGLLDDPLIKGMHVKMSGCPNGCGRHHMADIGFHGAAMKGPGGGQIPAYELFVGGSYESADVRYGIRPKGKVPAKRVPDLVLRLLGFYKDQRQEGEPFREFAARLGPGPFEAILHEFREVGPLGKETIDLYMDYEKTVLYKMERGEGECGV